jgi:hypothetical protein
MATYRKRKPSARALNSGLWVRRLFNSYGKDFAYLCHESNVRYEH